MPVRQVKFQDPKQVEIRWSSWAKGLNNLIAPSKIRDDELSIANNIVLVDEGAPSKRWGSEKYGANTNITGAETLYPYYKSDGTNKLLVKDGGFIKTYTSGVGALVSGASFTSGVTTRGVLAFDTLYLTNGVDNLTKFDGSGLSNFVALSAPTSTGAFRNGSLVSGQYTYSYRVTAVRIGETTGSTPAGVVYTSKNRDNWNPNTTIDPNYSTSVRWVPVTGATGYNIYGTTAGDERYLDHVDGEQVTEWIDYGTKIPSDVFVLPTGNTTQGPKGKYIIEFKSSLIIAGDPTNPSRVYYSGGIDKIDSFIISDGGGYVDISKNSDDGQISGLANYQNKAIVFKERSIWQLDFTEGAIPSLINLRKGLGCVSHDSIQAVENDLFFMGRKVGGGYAKYVLGNEPNYLNVLRTNEISNRVRPEFMAVAPASIAKATSIYADGKCMDFFPTGGSNYNSVGIIYDRERLGHTKWTELNPRSMCVYYDSDNEEHLLFTDALTGKIKELSSELTNDDGTAIVWNFKTKETDVKDPFLYKKFKRILLRFRNVRGQINLKVWTDGTGIAYSTSINSNSFNTAFRSGKFRSQRFRKTALAGEVTSDSTVIRRLQIGRQGTAAIARSIALEVSGSLIDSRAVMLDMFMAAQPKSKNYYPRSEDIT